MADRLETRLQALTPEWPATPDLEARVVAAIAERPARRRAPRRRLLAAVAAALLLLVPAAAVAFPGARDDVLEWLGLKDVRVERQQRPPTGNDPQLGRAVALEDAARAAGFAPLQLAGRGAPDAVHVRGEVVSLVYGDLLLAQRRGGVEPELLRKIVGPSTPVERVDVGGAPGVFLGEPHVYLWLDPSGQVREDRPVRSGPSLVWERDGVVARLEGEGDRDAAVALAEGAAPR